MHIVINKSNEMSQIDSGAFMSGFLFVWCSEHYQYHELSKNL